jgi:hypothetical protein
MQMNALIQRFSRLLERKPACESKSNGILLDTSALVQQAEFSTFIGNHTDPTDSATNEGNTPWSAVVVCALVAVAFLVLLGYGNRRGSYALPITLCGWLIWASTGTVYRYSDARVAYKAFSIMFLALLVWCAWLANHIYSISKRTIASVVLSVVIFLMFEIAALLGVFWYSSEVS